MSNIEAALRAQLQSEQWTTLDIKKFTVSQFKELNQLLINISNDAERNAIFQLCEEVLAQSDKSVVALYILATINLQRQSVDDSHNVAILELFFKNQRWNIVEQLCQSFLHYGENRHILRVLAQCYEKLGNNAKKIATWERLIRIDFDECEIVYELANIKKQEGDEIEAINYYKKALHRNINKNNFTKIHELWQILSELRLEEIDFFMQVESKVAKHIAVDQVILLLEELYGKYKEKKQWTTAVAILKRILAYNTDNSWARKELIACYMMLYKGHSNLEEFIRESNLNQSWRNVNEAIADFEKHISFDANNFVFHRNWGVGIIREINDDSITIDFPRNKGHQMSLKMALTALEILPKDHIWVLRSVIKPEKLKKMVKENVRKTLMILISSFSNAIDMKTIRAELVPYVLSEKEWVSWNNRARKILKTDSSFGTVPDMPDHYELRKQPTSLVEKIYNSFIAEKQFFARVRIVLDFLKIYDEAIPESDTEMMRDICDYFSAYLRRSDINVQTIASLLTLRKVTHIYSYLRSTESLTLNHYIENPENAVQLYRQIENRDLQQEFIEFVRHELKDWHILYLELLREQPSKFILNELRNSTHAEQLYEALHNLATDYRQHHRAFMWIILNQEQFPWMSDYLPEKERLCIAIAHLLEITTHEIANRHDMVENRKLLRGIRQYLFKDAHLLELAEKGNREIVRQLLPILTNLQKIEPAAIIEAQKIISARFPDMEVSEILPRKKQLSEDITDLTFRTILSSYLSKQRELQYIHDVEVPENSKEIQRAREMGDLRENAEYKSAKERQQLLNITAARLKRELTCAVVTEKESIDTNKVGFGTQVLLIDTANNQQENYTLLGPWESDPDNLIISYQSPLGKELFNHIVGDTIKFQRQGEWYSYLIEKIELAPQFNSLQN